MYVKLIDVGPLLGRAMAPMEDVSDTRYRFGSSQLSSNCVRGSKGFKVVSDPFDHNLPTTRQENAATKLIEDVTSSLVGGGVDEDE